tara:strand:+ start:60 stop:476 length:417 start_codon:yes stop_codon:yes gene_type:complete
VKGFLLFSFYLGGAGALFLILGAIGLANLNKLMSPSDEKFSTDQVKNQLVNGVKECAVREALEETTAFKEASSFSEEYTSSKFFEIKPIEPNTCFKAIALPKNNKKHTWFEIKIKEKGTFLKTCGDSSKPGCKEGNNW